MKENIMHLSEADLVNKIQLLEGLEDVTSLIDLIDRMESGGWEEEKLKRVLELLFSAFFLAEPESQYMKDDLQRALNKLILMSDYRFVENDLEIPLKIILESEDESKVEPALNMLSKTFDTSVAQMIENAVSHKSQSVKNRAIQAIDLIYSRPQY